MMLRGIKCFYCSECGKRFFGPDLELGATALSQPLRCPHCGKWRTRPWTVLPAKIANRAYKAVWDRMDPTPPK